MLIFIKLTAKQTQQKVKQHAASFKLMNDQF